MKIRINTLWRVPVFCLVCSCISSYVTMYFGGYFFAVIEVGVDGVTSISADPLRASIFHGVLFSIVLLLGGLWAFRTMTKLEITVSAAIISAIYLAIILMELYWPHFPVSIRLELFVFFDWVSTVSVGLFRMTGLSNFSSIVACFSPFLFVPFGRTSIHASK